MALAGLALALLPACQVDLAVAVDAGTDGSGQVEATVRLDRQASEQVPDLAAQLQVRDLERAGWHVTGPSRRDDGGTEVKGVKSFRSPAGARRVVEELAGPNGAFRDFRLSQRRSYWKTRTRLSGVVDLSGGLDVFSDEVLRQRLGGAPLGADPAALERHLGRPLADAVRFRVVARLPGADPEVWSPRLGERQALEASAQAFNLRSIGAGAVSVLSGLALLAVLARRLLSRS